MRSCVIVVPYEAPMLPEQVKFSLVRFMKRLNLATCCRPAHACSDMLNPQAQGSACQTRTFRL